jgi:Ca2+-binding EF-hand superfamily protein
MELREMFENADADKGGALEIEEFTEAFGGVLGKDMNPKQLKQLFMKIDADSNGSVGTLLLGHKIFRMARIYELHAS